MKGRLHSANKFVHYLNFKYLIFFVDMQMALMAIFGAAFDGSLAEIQKLGLDLDYVLYNGSFLYI